MKDKLNFFVLEWKKYENFCSNSLKKKIDGDRNSKNYLRRQISSDKILHQSDEQIELESLI